MTISMQQVRAALDPDEPRYAEAAQLGPAALPFLRQLIEGDDPLLAAKATYLAGLIGDPGSQALLLVAARSDEPVVRIAAAGAARSLRGEPATQVLLPLLDDADLGVRKVALSAVRGGASSALLKRVEELSQREPEAALRTHASVALRRGAQSLEPEEECCEPCAAGQASEAAGVGVGGGSIQGAAVGGGYAGSGGGSSWGEADAHQAAPLASAAHAGEGGGSISSAARPALHTAPTTSGLGAGGGVLPKPDPLFGVGTGGGDLGAATQSKER